MTTCNDCGADMGGFLLERCGTCSRKLPTEVAFPALAAIAATSEWFPPTDPASVALRAKVEAAGGLSAYLRGLNREAE